MKRPVEQLHNKVLDVVVENFDYFRTHPRHLAWAMMHFELIHRVGGRTFNYDCDNPRYIVNNVGEKFSDKTDADLLYDAWGVTISMGDEFPDTNPNLPLEEKLNKTFNEWIELLTDKRFVHHTLFPDEFSVRDHLLCTLGTGYRWNSEGFIAPIGVCGTDQTIFAGYTRAQDEVQYKIRRKITKLRCPLDHPRISSAIYRYLKKTQINAQRIYGGEDWCEVLMGKDIKYEEIKKQLKSFGIDTSQKCTNELFQTKDHYYPLSEFSNLVRIPANAHLTYVYAGLEIAKEIIQNPKEPKQSKKFAREFLQKRGV